LNITLTGEQEKLANPWASLKWVGAKNKFRKSQAPLPFNGKEDDKKDVK